MPALGCTEHIRTFCRCSIEPNTAELWLHQAHQHVEVEHTGRVALKPQIEITRVGVAWEEATPSLTRRGMPSGAIVHDLETACSARAIMAFART